MKFLHPDSGLARDLFIGGILTATSVGITARVLRDLWRDATDEARVILGAGGARRRTQPHRARYRQCAGPDRRSQRLEHRLDEPPRPHYSSGSPKA
jgi:hypothetical protein